VSIFLTRQLSWSNNVNKIKNLERAQDDNQEWEKLDKYKEVLWGGGWIKWCGFHLRRWI